MFSGLFIDYMKTVIIKRLLNNYQSYIIVYAYILNLHYNNI